MRRAGRRANPAERDINHLHHRMMRLGHGQTRSVLILWTWTALLSALVLYPALTGKDNVVVLMDRKGDDRKLKLPETSNLHLFRREVGPLVLYEISPLNEQRVLPKALEAKA